jgi:hypothetical protein
MAKDAKGHGSNAKPISGSPMHTKTNDELRFIAKDAAEAGRNAQEMGDQRGISKYADQVADAATVMGYRARGGKSDAPADQLHSGTPKSDTVPVHDSMVQDTYPGAGPAPSHWSATDQASYNAKNGWSRSNPNYHAGAVQNAINSSNRSGRRIGGREAKMIHRLLSGR